MGQRKSQGPRGIAPRHQKPSVTLRPSRAEAAFPIGEYMVPSSDALGRSVTVTTTVAPISARMASVILGKGLFGFKTQQDIWRFCIDRGLNVLTEQSHDEEIAGVSAMVSSWVRVARVNMEHAYYEDSMRQIEKSLNAITRRGNAAKAEQLAEEIHRQHDKMDDQYWRVKFRKMAKRILDRAREARKREEEE